MERWREATAAQPRLWNQSKYRLAGHSFDSEGRPQLQVELLHESVMIVVASPLRVETQLQVGFGKLVLMIIMVNGAGC